MDYDDLEIENLALEIRRHFISLKSRQKGRTYKPHKSHDKPEVWKKAAMTCSSLNCNPVDFVQIAFDKATNGPYPKTLGGKSIVSWVTAHTNNITPEDGCDNIYEQELEVEIKTAENFCWTAAVSSNKPFEEVVRSSIVPISAYMRIFLCQDPQTAFMYRTDAVKELTGNPGIVEALKKKQMDMKLIFE